ncbi:type II toxin-antitoxin system RelE family toxin [Catellatospora tritici]|uniref:type II toxin-antitoxin system RelE family toxin n=1 Tax=Catellatospora tritici TaxID=2851566 RepID=UPI001C2D646F|nr:type II toxin-antitoxin system RelE/ParE family toxin [Catellatospora tritici]MBV1853352.1 type II toxin-antitoxin system RelE/ParE family toxin [Catellatospora tritici]
MFRPVLDTTLSLIHNPRPTGAINSSVVAATTGAYGVGEYRIVYEIDDQAPTVTVMRVAHRRDVYR